MELIKKHVEKIKFAIVGGANTALDFLILFLLTAFGMNAIVANYFSTGISFIFSFFVNKSFTFQHKGGSVAKQFALFIIKIPCVIKQWCFFFNLRSPLLIKKSRSFHFVWNKLCG